MKRLFALFLFLPAIGWAADESTPIKPSVVQELWFQNGVYPTPAYNGITLSGMDPVAVDSTYGDGKPPSDSLITIGCGQGGDAQWCRRGLLKIDTSGYLQDSTLVVFAEVHFLKTTESDSSGGYVAGSTISMLFSRCHKPWDTKASWNSYSTGNAWTSPGAGGKQLTGTYYGVASFIINTPSGRTKNTMSIWTHGTYSGSAIKVAVGSDSISTGVNGTGGDVTDQTAIPFTARAGATQDYPYWLRFEITPFIRNWVSGAWTNNGLVFGLDGLGESSGAPVMKSTFQIVSHCSHVAHNPLVIVRYVYALPTSGRRATTRIGPFR